MPRKKDMPSEIVSWFQEASPETAATVLAIVKGIVARKQPAKAKRQPNVAAPPK